MKPDEYNHRQRVKLRIDSHEWNWLVTRGVRSVQEEAGLIVDGKCGPKTLAAGRKLLAEAGDVPPIPQPKKQLRDLLGSFSYENKYTTSAGGSKRYAGIKIDPAWVRANIVRVRLHTGQVRRMHKSAAAEFAQLFEEACNVSGYTPRSVQTFVPRHKNWNPRATLSLHAYGLAVDFDPALNAMFDEDATIYEHPEFIEVFKTAGWIFGGDFKYAKEKNKPRRGGDPMHFQRAGRRC